MMLLASDHHAQREELIRLSTGSEAVDRLLQGKNLKVDTLYMLVCACMHVHLLHVT